MLSLYINNYLPNQNGAGKQNIYSKIITKLLHSTAQVKKGKMYMTKFIMRHYHERNIDKHINILVTINPIAIFRAY